MTETQTYTRQHPLRELAAKDSRGISTPEEATMLRQPENLRGWRDALSELNTDLEAQFAENKAESQEVQNACYRKGFEGKQEWFEYKAGYDRWRAGARRFKRGIEARIKEARTLQTEGRDREDREALIKALRRAQAFLRREENIAYSAMPECDELLEEIGGLFGGVSSDDV